MANLLAIETSYQLCSVALSFEGKIYKREITGSRSHTEYLLAFIDEVIVQANIDIHQLDAIVFAAGPGTFTGVRLATSVAKSLAYAANLPIIAISSLAVIAQAYQRENASMNTCRVITDARMGEVYMGDYECRQGLVTAIKDDQLLTIQQLQQLPMSCSIILGDNLEIIRPYAVSTDTTYQLCSAYAEDVLMLGQSYFEQGRLETALSAQAIYLRDKSGWKTTKQQLAEKKA